MDVSAQRIRVALYEDNNALRESLCQLLEIYPEFQLAGSYSNAINILSDIKLDQPEVIVMDIDMPGITGIEAVEKVHKKYPGIKILMQTVFDEEEKIFNS